MTTALNTTLSHFNLTRDERRDVIEFLQGRVPGGFSDDVCEAMSFARFVPKSDLWGLPQASNGKLEAIAGDHATVVAQVHGEPIPVRITDGNVTVTLVRASDGWYAYDGEATPVNPEFANA